MKKRVNYDFERRKKEQDRQRKKEAKLQRKQAGQSDREDEAVDPSNPPADERSETSSG